MNEKLDPIKLKENELGLNKLYGLRLNESKLEPICIQAHKTHMDNGKK